MGGFGYQRTYTIGNIYGVKTAPTAGRRVKIGVVGAGSASQGRHFPALMRLMATGAPVQVLCVADPIEDRARKVAEQYGLRAYGEPEEMVRKEHIDGILILTPDDTHVRLATLAVNAGIHTFVEKPMAQELDEALALCRLAEERKVVLMTGFCKRYSAPYWEARQIVKEHIWPPAMAHMKMCQGWATDALLERQFCHAFDLLRYFLGDVEEVHAIGVNQYRANRHYPVDNVIATFRFVSGTIASFYGSGSAPSLKPWERLEIYGDHRWLSVEDQWELRYYPGEDQPTQTWTPVMSNSILYSSEFMGYVGELGNFAKAILGEEEVLVTGWDGYRALEIVHAVRTSLRTGAAVRLSCENGSGGVISQ
jgi:predicted dehydrogenase